MKSRKHLYLIIVVLIVPCVVGQMSGDDDGDDLAIDLSAYGTRLYGTPQKSAGEMLKKWQLSQENSAENSHVLVNPEEIGPYVEGDILIPRSTATSSDGRNGMVAESYRWHDGIIPIELIGPFDTRAMKLIEEAIQSYHDNTCLKFMPRRRTDLDYISIQSGSTGCWSSVGRIGGRQVVNLQSPGCTTKVGTVIHELMHASGFLHEQNREERDEFVDIRFENVRKGYENNFEKASPGLASGFGVDYDYGSVMHYSTGAFTVNGQPTIVTKHNEVIGQRDGFSKSDVTKINSMYKCSATTSSTGYKPVFSITSLTSSGGIEDIWNMIIPTDAMQSNGVKKY